MDDEAYDVLGLPRGTTDAAEVRRAYARTIRVLRPDTDPDGFVRARGARDRLLSWIASGARPETVVSFGGDRAFDDADEASLDDAASDPERDRRPGARPFSRGSRDSELEQEIWRAIEAPTPGPALALAERLKAAPDGASLAAVVALATRIAVIAGGTAWRIADAAWSAAPASDRGWTSLDELDRRARAGIEFGRLQPPVRRALWTISGGDGRTVPDLGADRDAFLDWNHGRGRGHEVMWLLSRIPASPLRTELLRTARSRDPDPPRVAAARLRKVAVSAVWIGALLVLLFALLMRSSAWRLGGWPLERGDVW